ncbi:MAG TPA: right-handed parallel beta-helix repeat-containing protein, partial [Candidatus Binatia bacterium]|nr:right-handed parallel beta-helix repeat-containing protein [Candidatus Binatia bacterium]
METQLRRLKPSKLIFIGLLSLVLASASVSWAQIVVTTLADSGPGSLRQAIIDASADGVATTITFDPAVFPPPPALPGLILLATPLPNLTGTGDTIDGTGAGVVLDGSALAAGSVGLRVRRSNYTIRGLTIQNMPSDGIRVETPPPPSVTLNVTGVLITGNTLNQNRSRGIRVLGGTGPGKTVSASITNNTVADNLVGGITVSANSGDIGSGDPGGNQVDVIIDGNFVSGAVLGGTAGGNGISISGGSGDGSNNVV